MMSYGSCSFVVFFVCPLVILVYCYGRMVVVMRRQMRVMAGHAVEPTSHVSASQAQSKRLKWNIIKTMTLVSVTFVISWFPNNFYFVIFPFPFISSPTSFRPVFFSSLSLPFNLFFPLLFPFLFPVLSLILFPFFVYSFFVYPSHNPFSVSSLFLPKKDVTSTAMLLVLQRRPEMFRAVLVQHLSTS